MFIDKIALQITVCNFADRDILVKRGFVLASTISKVSMQLLYLSLVGFDSKFSCVLIEHDPL